MAHPLFDAPNWIKELVTPFKKGDSVEFATTRLQQETRAQAARGGDVRPTRDGREFAQHEVQWHYLVQYADELRIPCRLILWNQEWEIWVPETKWMVFQRILCALRTNPFEYGKTARFFEDRCRLPRDPF